MNISKIAKMIFKIDKELCYCCISGKMMVISYTMKSFRCKDDKFLTYLSI